MDDVGHPDLIEENKNIDTTAYKNNLNQDVKIPPIKKKNIAMKKLNAGQQA